MSQENVEIVQAAWEAWNAGDIGSATSAFHPEVRWHVAEDEPDAETVVGIEGVVREATSWAAAFEDFRGEPQEFIDVGERVVVLIHFRGRARETDSYVEIEETQVYLLRDRKIIEVREYRSRAEALEAVGLQE